MQTNGWVSRHNGRAGGFVSMGPKAAIDQVLGVREECEGEVRTLVALSRQGVSADMRRAAMRLSARLDFARQQLDHLQHSPLRGLAGSDLCTDAALSLAALRQSLDAVLARQAGPTRSRPSARRPS